MFIGFSFPSASRLAHGFVTCVSAFAIGIQPILAQGVVPDANAQGGLNVGTAQNGVPLINIATPNSQGLSHNTYDQFNVGANGLILNNESGTFSQTQLGGVVSGNANLANSGSARVILNEVVSANRSTLGGVVEVAGQSADVIIANPNGITCNGCGFIRTPRVVLTTGTPDISGGALQGFTVNGGDITFGANGADLSQVSLFDIISRQVTFDGAVAAQDVRIAAGRNSVDYATGSVTALAANGSTAPTFGVDSTAVGGLYAGRITLLSTETGVAARMPQEMSASTGGMTLTADGRLIIGRAQAAGPANIRSNAGDVRIETSLFSDDAITLTGVSAEIAANATLAGSSDLTIAADDVTVGTGGLIAAGMDANGNLGAAGDLTIAADTIAATDARFAAAGDADLRADAITLDQATTAQSLSVQGNLTVQTLALSAIGAGVAVGGDASITSTGPLAVTGGDYAIGGDLDIAATDLTNTANVQAGGDVDLATSTGNLTNAGDIAASGTLAVTSAGDLTNSGALTAALTGSLSATGDVTNSGSVVTADDLTVTGANIFNSGPLGSSARDVTITTLGDITNTGLIYGGRNVRLALDGTFLNDTADVIAENAITIEGLTGTRAAAVLNRSANIEAITGSILIAAALVENSQPVPNIIPQVTVTTVTGTAADFPNINHPNNTFQVVQTTTVTTMVVDPATNAPARILAGDNLTIDANNITNDYSQMAANGDVTLNAQTVTNIGQNLVQTTEVVTVSRYSERYCRSWNILGLCIGGYAWRTRMRNNTQTTTATAGGLFATIQAGGTLTANVTGYLGNNAVRGNATQVGLSSGGRALANPPLVGSVNPNVILNRSALFVPSNNPNGPFLIETRPEFIDVSRFLSSDYFLQQIGGYDANITMRRFGDAYVEARLIQEQLFALTGRRTAEDPDELRAIMQRFYDNALNALDDLSLTPGVALTPEQVAALTDTIIWMEEQVIDGQVVLVPVVYLGPNAANEISLDSAQLVAFRIDIEAGTAVNSGLITGDLDLEINTTGDFLNIGGQITSAGDIGLDIDGRFANVSGQVAGQDVTITAATVTGDQGEFIAEGGTLDINAVFGAEFDRGSLTGDAIEVSTVFGDLDFRGVAIAAETDVDLSSTFGDVTLTSFETVTDIVSPQQINILGIDLEIGDAHSVTDQTLTTLDIGGNLNISAFGDVTLAGVQGDIGGDVGLDAGGDLILSAVQSGSEMSSGGGRNSREETIITSHVTDLTIGGSFNGTAGGTALFVGTQIDAGGDVSIVADDIVLAAARDIYRYEAQSSRRGLFSRRSSSTSILEITHQGVDISGGGDLSLVAIDGDLTLAGASFEVDGDIVLGATGDVLAGTYTDIRQEQHTSSRSALFGLISSSSSSFRRNETAFATDALAGADLSVVSGEDTTLIGTGLEAGGTLLIQTGGDLTVDAAISSTRLEEFAADTGLILATTETTRQLEETGQYASLIGNDVRIEAAGDVIAALYSRAGETPPPLQDIMPEALLALDGVTYLENELAFEDFHEETQALSPAFKALVTIVITQGVGAMGGGLGFAQGTLGISNTWLAAGVDAFATSFAVNSIDGIVSGNFDIGEILEGAALSGITAGVTAGLSEAVIGTHGPLLDANGNALLGTNGMPLQGYSGGMMSGYLNGLPNTSLLGFGTGNFSVTNIVRNGVDNVISAGVNSAVYGTDFGDAFMNGMTTSMVNLAMADVQNVIGDHFANGANGGEGSLGHAFLHGATGCAAAVLQDANCAAGAAGAVASSLYAGSLEGGIGSDSAANIIGATAGWIFSGGDAANVNVAAAISSSAYNNNYLRHHELVELEQLRGLCTAGDPEACSRMDELQTTSEERFEELENCVGVYTAACQNARSEVLEAAAEIFEAVESYPTDGPLPIGSLGLTHRQLTVVAALEYFDPTDPGYNGGSETASDYTTPEGLAQAFRDGDVDGMLVGLGATATGAVVASVAEHGSLGNLRDRINAERAARGLPPLVADRVSIETSNGATNNVPERILVRTDGAGNSVVSIHGREMSIHASQQATTRGISNESIAGAMDQTPFQYRQNGDILDGFYDPATNTFVGVGDRITTVIRPRNPENYLNNLRNRQ